MLLPKEQTVLKGFLIEAYGRLGYDDPERRALAVVQAFESTKTAADALEEVSTVCDRIQQLDDTIAGRAQWVRRILAEVMARPEVPAHHAETEDTGALFGPEYERRFRHTEEQAATEAAVLRHLDACELGLLFSLYDLPEEDR